MIRQEINSTKAVGYIRVSGERQVINGYGLDAQESDIRKHADYKSWHLVNIFRETGVSGYKRHRPALDEMLKGAAQGLFNVVIFASIDRVGRSVKDVIEIDSHLRQHKVNTVFLREGVDTSTPTGILFRNIMSSIAEFEGKIIYERLAKGKQAKAQKGGYIGGWIPYGYIKENGKIVLAKDQAEAVRKIFRLRSEGRILKWICSHLNHTCVKTQFGGQWHTSTIRRILGNRFYTSRRQIDGEWINADHPSIISDKAFEELQLQKTL